MVRQDIDSGHPSPLGLVRVLSSDPFALKQNHQVLAYGYDVLDGRLTLHLYDPNLPNRDDVKLALSIAEPTRPATVSSFPAGPPVLALFRTRYLAAPPP